MDPRRWNRVKQLLIAAGEVERGERAAFLKRESPDDPELVREVLSLLEAKNRARGFLSWSEAGCEPAPVEPDVAPEVPGFRLLRCIGRGGMGEAWEAEQLEPVRRRVAIKLIRAGWSSEDVVVRFQMERQALALMDHPNIARVFDAGYTRDERPYFVMEYVEGVPIDEHCDRLRLTTRERLELFVQVCQGVQHAHQKAVIHRDLKPSNVLVTMDGTRATPKIIDFGVAKVLAHKLSEQTFYTEAGMLIGTPEYMSPEQAEMSGNDVGTWTDVYSLGVMLYELLVGVLPFDPDELRGAGIDGVRRIIREEEPPRPSTRLGTLPPERSTESAKRRRVDAPTLFRQLSGDLDWISLKALEKDLARRYATPAELAEDVGRYLGDEPVRARPPSTIYRARKFVRRHRIGVAAAAVVLLTLLGGIVATTWQAVRAGRQQRVAERQAVLAEAANDFIRQMLSLSAPAVARGEDLTVGDLLHTTSRKVESDPPDDPLVEAQIRSTLVETYSARGQHDLAEPHASRTVEILREQYGETRRETIEAELSLASTLVYRNQADRAEPLLRRVSELAKETFGEGDRTTWHAMESHAHALVVLGRKNEAVEIGARLLQIQTGGGVEPGYTHQLLSYVAATPMEQFEHSKRAVEILREQMGVEHQDTQQALARLGTTARVAERTEEARALYEELLAVQRRVLPEKSELIGSTLHGLLYLLDWDSEEAESVARESLEIFVERRPPCDGATFDAYHRLGMILLARNKYEDSAASWQEMLDGMTGCNAPDAREGAMIGVAKSLRLLGQYERAEALLREVDTAQVARLGPTHEQRLKTIWRLSKAILPQGEFDEAEQLALECHRETKARFGAGHPRTVEAVKLLVEVYEARGDEKEAAVWRGKLNAATSRAG